MIGCMFHDVPRYILASAPRIQVPIYSYTACENNYFGMDGIVTLEGLTTTSRKVYLEEMNNCKEMRTKIENHLQELKQQENDLKKEWCLSQNPRSFAEFKECKKLVKY